MYGDAIRRVNERKAKLPSWKIFEFNDLFVVVFCCCFCSLHLLSFENVCFSFFFVHLCLGVCVFSSSFQFTVAVVGVIAVNIVVVFLCFSILPYGLLNFNLVNVCWTTERACGKCRSVACTMYNSHTLIGWTEMLLRASVPARARAYTQLLFCAVQMTRVSTTKSVEVCGARQTIELKLTAPSQSKDRSQHCSNIVILHNRIVFVFALRLRLLWVSFVFVFIPCKSSHSTVIIYISSPYFMLQIKTKAAISFICSLPIGNDRVWNLFWFCDAFNIWICLRIPK